MKTAETDSRIMSGHGRDEFQYRVLVNMRKAAIVDVDVCGGCAGHVLSKTVKELRRHLPDEAIEVRRGAHSRGTVDSDGRITWR